MDWIELVYNVGFGSQLQAGFTLDSEYLISEISR